MNSPKSVLKQSTPISSKFSKFAAIPFDGLGIGEIHQGHSRLPGIALKNSAIECFQEISVVRALREKFGKL